MSKQILTSIVMCILMPVVICQQLPIDIKKCDYGDTKCLIASINDVIMRYPKGIPEINFKPIDKLQLKDLTLYNSPKHISPHIFFKLDEVVLKGFENTTITGVGGFEKNPTKSRIEIHGQVPSLTISGPYHCRLRFTLFSVNASSTLKMDLQNFQFSLLINAVTEYHFNKRYLKIAGLVPVLKIDRFIIQLEDFYVDNTDLTYILNKILNDLWVEIWNEIEPHMVSTVSAVLNKLLNSFFEHVSYDDMFLQNSAHNIN